MRAFRPADCNADAVAEGSPRDTNGEDARPGVGATMAEVAALAGVTKMTVSRVLRHPEKVNADTRARVSRGDGGARLRRRTGWPAG